MAGQLSGGRAELERATQLLGRVVAGFEPERLDADAALAYLGLFAKLGKLAEAGQALAARRVDACGAYRRSGHQSAAHLVAATAGVAVVRASTAVEVGKRLLDQPLADDAFRRGSLSLDQAVPITEAVAADPGAEAGLLQIASRETVGNLRERARSVRLAAECDREERYARQRALRTFRHGVDRDGMVYGNFRLPPDTGAAVVNRIEQEADRGYRAADRDRRHHDSYEQHAADALVAVVTGTAAAAGPGAEVVVHVSHDALLRGSVEGDELCTVEGVGDVPVAAARGLLDDAFLKGVLVDGTEVQRVKHFGRRASAAVRTALRVGAVLGGGQQVRCADPGCGRRAGIEWDHIEPHARGGPTEIANLQPLCRYHHREKTAGRLVLPP